MKKISLGILIGVGVLILVVVLLGMFKFNFLSSLDGFDVDGNPIVICTDDAKGCPDGTSVGRTGQNCEFEKCPGNTLKKDLASMMEDLLSSETSKARDSVRINDLKSLQAMIEQSYNNNAKYPTKENFQETILAFWFKIPKDPSWNIEINGCRFWYIYEVWPNKYGMSNQIYRLSACLENTKIATRDWGIDNKRFEIWRWIWVNKNEYTERFYINWHTNWIKK